MFKKKKPLYIIVDQVLKKKRKRYNLFTILINVVVIIIALNLHLSLFVIVLLLFILNLINSLVIYPTFNHEITLFAEKFIYTHKNKQIVVLHENISYIDQDVQEYQDFLYYNHLTFYTETFEVILDFPCKNFIYDELVNMCIHIQEANCGSAEQNKSFEERFLNAVSVMDDY